METFKAGGEGTIENEMIGWNTNLMDMWLRNPAVSDGLGKSGLLPTLGCKESDTTEDWKPTGKVTYFGSILPQNYLSTLCQWLYKWIPGK